jgi:hypothetical protein
MTRRWFRCGVLAVILLQACLGDDDAGGDATPAGARNSDATETNVAPAPCNSDADCPDDVRCRHFEAEGAAGPGFCDVNMEAGSASTEK